MATTFNTPGVYIQEIPVFAPSVVPVETAIPAFIGYTVSGSSTSPVVTRITSLIEFEQNFGKAHLETSFSVIVDDTVVSGNLANRAISVTLTPSGYNLYYNIQMYFANGGGPCYIVSVGSAGSSPDTVDKQDFIDGLNAIAKIDEPTLLVFPDAVNLGDADYGTVYQTALAQCNKLQDRFTVGDLRGDDIGTTPVSTFRGALGSNNLKYGAVYAPFLQTGLGYSYQDSGVTVTYRINNVVQAGTTLAFFAAGAGTNLLLYNQVTQALQVQKPVILPPSPAVVGLYAAVDRDRGVWKAPANVSLTLVNAPTIAVTEAQQGDLNVDPTSGKSINVIRSFVGRGIIVWGSRTLDGNSNEWRYVPVRRLFIMAEESIRKATEPVVFESNDKSTWLRVKSTINNFLTDLWKQGALAGDKPEQAFFVKVGLNETMTAQDILEGKMIVQVGMAAVRPAEFIVLQFMHKLQEA